MPHSQYREQRFDLVRKMIFDIIDKEGRCDILDVGGEYDYWRPFIPSLSGLPLTVLMANVEDRTPAFEDKRFTACYGNACDLSFIKDKAYHLAFSNSVIEHVGRWNEMRKMAAEVRRVAKAYYVQTPYFWFPIEPHYRMLGYHWLPDGWRARLHMLTNLGFFAKARNFDEAMFFTHRAKLIDKRQMCTLFPDATVTFEKFMMLPKSLVAVRPYGAA